MDDLTGPELEELRGALIRLHGELGRALEGSREAAAAVSLEQPIGRVSRMDAIQQQKVAQASRRQRELRLGQVRVALHAIEAGDYGACRSCEEPIGVERLRARPEASLCRSCQGGRERR